MSKKHRSFQIILVFILGLLSIDIALGQQCSTGILEGDYSYNSISIGTTCTNKIEFSNVRDVKCYSNDYTSQAWQYNNQLLNDIFYTFTITIPKQGVAIAPVNYATYIHLLRSDGTLIASNNGQYAATGTITQNLPAGTYTIVAEPNPNSNGSTSNKSVGISLVVPASGIASEGGTMSNPFNVGTLPISSTGFTHTRDTSPLNCFGNDYSSNQPNGQAADDIYYKFTLDRSLRVTASNCFTTYGPPTYMHLLDNAGNWIESNGGGGAACPTSSSASIVRDLTAGTYYLVVEGKGTNSWNITTNISGCATGMPTVTVTPAAPTVDAGHSATLIANGACSYTWAPALYLNRTTGASVIATPPVTTTYTVTATSLTGETAQTSVTVTVRQNNNYVITNTLLVDNVKTAAEASAITDPTQRQQQIAYFDDLGRPMQQIMHQGSPMLKDIVIPTFYDSLGRNPYAFLPYVGGVTGLGTNGFFQANALDQQKAFYNPVASTDDKITDDTAPFARTVFEASPLSRVQEQGATGAAWQPRATSHAIKVTQRTNRTNEVRRFDFNTTSQTFTTASGTAGFYEANQLLVKETYDEHNILTSEYVDKQGRVVLKKISPTTGTVCNINEEAIYQTTATVGLTPPPGMVLTSIQSATWGTGTGALSNCEGFTFNPQQQADATMWVQAMMASALSSPVSSLSVPIRRSALGPDPAPSLKKTLKVVATYAPVSEAGNMLTYYAYDDLGNLRLVISPEGSTHIPASAAWTPTPAFLRNWCFTYSYDERQRVTEKQVPGSGRVLLVYNQRDQLVLTQDANQEPNSEWTFTKYDVLGRSIMTGRYVNRGHLTPSQLRTQIEAAPQWEQTVDSNTAGQVHYTLTNSFPTAIQETDLLTITYYDQYTFDGLAGRSFEEELGLTQEKLATTVRGLVTGTAERVLDGSAAGPWLTRVLYYDQKNRVVQTQQDLYPDGYARTSLLLDFTGKATASLLTQDFPSSSEAITKHTILQEMDYDHMGRLVETRQSVDDQPQVILARHEYNEVGQPVDKRLHSTDGNHFLQSVDYRYNIRGWLSRINTRDLQENEGTTAEADLFGMELYYNEDLALGNKAATPQYNGNIAGVMWRTNSDNTQHMLRGYLYSYDGANRIKEGTFRNYEPIGSDWIWGTTTSDYSVSNITYDANGNLRTMNRKGLISGSGQPKEYGDLDELKYHYDTDTDKTNDGESNRLLAVDDTKLTAAKHDFEDLSGTYTPGSTSLAEYIYDEMGNLKSDQNKGIKSISYSYLNLPQTVDLSTTRDSKIISYIYTATGTKLSKKAASSRGGIVSSSTTTYYAGSFVYETKEGTSVVLQPVTLLFAHMPEGRLLFRKDPPTQGFNWKYEYHLKDHLGNLRFAFRDEGDDELQRMLSMEPVNAAQEEEQFERVAETRMQDAAHARTGNYVARLNAREGRRLGPSISWPVAAGDSIYAEVYGRYDHPALVSKVLQKGAIVAGAAAAGSPATVATDQIKATPAKRRVVPFFGASLAIVPQLFKRQKEELPQAFLRYELYNQDSQLVATRIQPLVRTATDEWQRLTTGMKADSAGYVRVAVINESGTPAYFDDLALRSIDPARTQENHYDPWGMNLVGIEDAGEPDFKFQFNGKEKQEDFGLNWNDHGARMYDPSIGRWNSTDPHASNYYPLSPYCFAGNVPTIVSDLDGKDWFISSEKVNGETVINIRYEAAILDNSGRGINVSNMIATQKSAFQKVFQQGNVKASMDVRQIESVFQLKSSETLIEIKNEDPEFKDGHVGGYTTLGGNYIALNSKYIDRISGNFADKKTMMHEIGHTGGLVHTFELENDNPSMTKERKSYDRAQEDVPSETVDDLTNFMGYSSESANQFQFYGSTPYNESYFNARIGPATRGQIQSVVNKYWTGDANKKSSNE